MVISGISTTKEENISTNRNEKKKGGGVCLWFLHLLLWVNNTWQPSATTDTPQILVHHLILTQWNQRKREKKTKLFL